MKRKSLVLSFPLNLGLLAVIALLPVGCGSTKPIALSSSLDGAPIFPPLSPDAKVLVLKPVAEFKNLETEKPMPGFLSAGNAMGTLLSSSSRRVLRARNIDSLPKALAKKIEKSESTERIRENASLLTRGRVETVRSELAGLAANGTDLAVLVHHVDVKVGRGGSWDPNSGRITSPNSRAVFRAALIRCADGELLWKNDVLLRDMPKIGSDGFNESVAMLLSGFPRKKN